MTNFLHPPRQEGDPTPPPPDCEVGYGRPPIHTQFRKGDGRKRPGRPKGSRNLKTELIRIYTEPVVIKIGGKRRRMPAIIALLTLQFQRALTSDSRAAEAVFKKTKELGLFAPNEHCGSVELQTNETTSLPDPDFVAQSTNCRVLKRWLAYRTTSCTHSSISWGNFAIRLRGRRKPSIKLKPLDLRMSRQA